MGETIIFHTDGCCLRNPGGRGGYAVIAGEKAYSRGFLATTNNRMELMAVLHAMELCGERGIIHSDSRYVVNGSEWVKGWARNGWRNSQGDVRNRDLWERFLALKKPGVRIVWVKGHAGDPANELADRLANEAARLPEKELETDGGFAS